MSLKSIRRKRWIVSFFKKNWKTGLIIIIGAILLTLLSIGIEKGQVKPNNAPKEIEQKN